MNHVSSLVLNALLFPPIRLLFIFLRFGPRARSQLQLHRIEQLPRELCTEILQDVCRELRVTDAALILPVRGRRCCRCCVCVCVSV